MTFKLLIDSVFFFINLFKIVEDEDLEGDVD